MPADEYASTRALRENRLIENVEMGIVKDEGEITWISVTAAPIPLEGYGVAIAYGDISGRKRAEEALRKSESNLRALALELSLVEENERQRLALFLHDEIGQSLSLLRMKFGSLADASTSRAAKKDLRKARDLLEARSGVDGHRHAGSQRHRSDTPDHDRSPRSQSDPALHARG